MKNILFFLLIFTCNAQIKAQNDSQNNAQIGILKGKITSKNGESMPFVNVYIQNTTKGTTSNGEGEYQLYLPYGTHNIVFEYIGFQGIVEKITISTPTLERNVTLLEDNFEVSTAAEVTSKDPANEIIKNAQKNRKKYLREVEKYTCEVYLKGLNHIGKAPKTIMGMTIRIDTGIVYLSESISEVSAIPPNKIKEKMISSKVAGNNNGFSFNQATGLQVNFYENLTENDGFAERGMVSPIADNAFNYYTYKMEGFYQEKGLTINKIKVMPIRNTDPVFAGHIFIVEDSWRIYATDLYVTKDNQVQFIEKAIIKQSFIPSSDAKNAPWVIFSQRFDFEFEAFGINGDGYFIGIYSKYNMNPSIEKKDFTNEIFSINEEANKKDTTYWNGIRPVPLTGKETVGYFKKDSVQVIKETKVYKDSMDRISNKLKPINFLILGYSWRNTHKGESWYIGGLLNALQFNTVEGGVLNLTTGYTKRYKNRTGFSIQPTVRYGFADLTWKSKLVLQAQLNPKKQTKLSLDGGRFVEQINNTEPIDVIVNTSYTLFSELNFIKYYLSDYARLTYQSEVTNGIFLSAGLVYANRSPMTNHSNFKIFNIKDREYTSNTPTNFELDKAGKTADFVANKVLKFNITTKFTFAQKYSTRPNAKINEDSKYPTLQIAYTRALPTLGAGISYDRVQVDIDGKFKIRLLGTSNYKIFGGATLTKDSITFLDYQHFNGNQTNWSGSFAGYQMLNYYDFSTTKPYAGVLYNHHFNGAIFGRIAGLRKLKLQEVITANYLTSGTNGNYLEFGFGLENIKMLGRVDYFVSFLDGKFQTSGIRLGIGL